METEDCSGFDLAVVEFVDAHRPHLRIVDGLADLPTRRFQWTEYLYTTAPAYNPLTVEETFVAAKDDKARDKVLAEAAQAKAKEQVLADFRDNITQSFANQENNMVRSPEQFEKIITQLPLAQLMDDYQTVNSKIGALAEEDLATAIDTDRDATAEYRRLKKLLHFLIRTLQDWVPVDPTADYRGVALFASTPDLHPLERWYHQTGEGSRINYDDEDLQIHQAMMNIERRLQSTDNMTPIINGEIPGLTYQWVDSWDEYLRRLKAFAVSHENTQQFYPGGELNGQTHEATRIPAVSYPGKTSKKTTTNN